MGNVNPTATKFLKLLNEVYGWNLRGGSKREEFHISSRKGCGYYYFDGADLDKMVFFEYDEIGHESPERKMIDERKMFLLANWVKHQNKSALLIRYSEKLGALRTFDL